MKLQLLLFIALLYILPIASQDKMQAPDKEVKNKVGFMVTDLINGAFLFNYERALGKHIAVGLNAGYKGKEGFIGLSGLDTDKLKTGDITYSGAKFIPEFKYYLTEKENTMLTGFYFGAYFKYVNYRTDIAGNFIDVAGQSFDILFEAKMNVFSAGLMVGYKLDISKRFSIDFLIAGPGTANYSFKLKTLIPPPDEFYDALNEALEKYSILDFLNADFEFKDHRLSNS